MLGFQGRHTVVTIPSMARLSPLVANRTSTILARSLVRRSFGNRALLHTRPVSSNFATKSSLTDTIILNRNSPFRSLQHRYQSSVPVQRLSVRETLRSMPAYIAKEIRSTSPAVLALVTIEFVVTQAWRLARGLLLGLCSSAIFCTWLLFSVAPTDDFTRQHLIGVLAKEDADAARGERRWQSVFLVVPLRFVVSRFVAPGEKGGTKMTIVKHEDRKDMGFVLAWNT